jgi:hypothetical protein
MENLSNLFFILLISIPIFWIVMPAFANLLSQEQLRRYRNLWIAITLILFISHNYWLYVLLTIAAIQFTQQREHNKIALYFVLLFSMPPVWDQVGAFGMVEYLFDLKPWRILELAILLPAFLALIRQDDILPFGRTTPDKLLAGYIFVIFVFRFRETTPTDALREGLYAFTDIFLPYFVISRYLRDIKQFKQAFTAFVIAALLLSGAAIFEYAMYQLLYPKLVYDLHSKIEMSGMLARGNSLRALVTTGQPIALGYVLMVGIGIYLSLLRDIPRIYTRILLLALLAGGLFASISRGPWVGTAIMVIVYILLGPHVKKNMAWLIASIGVMIVAMSLNVLGSEKLVDLLPFIGKTDQFNADYRDRLLDKSLIVIQRNPLFGSVDYMHEPEMLSMVQGEGIVDIVNSYLGIALDHGMLGLILFAGFFLSILWGIYTALQQFRSHQVEHYMLGVTQYTARPDSREDPHYLLGATIFSVLVGILITIYSVSSITVIPVVYWAVAGLGAAYIQLQNQSKKYIEEMLS